MVDVIQLTFFWMNTVSEFCYIQRAHE